jgi:hypothetical protein
LWFLDWQLKGECDATVQSKPVAVLACGKITTHPNAPLCLMALRLSWIFSFIKIYDFTVSEYVAIPSKADS